MRLDRLTNKFQLALADAQSLALGHDNQFIEPLHLMSALLNQEGGSIRPLLTSAGINAGQLRTAIDQALSRLPQVEGTGGDVQPSSETGTRTEPLRQAGAKTGGQFYFVRAVCSGGA
ncbi:hypothetical protein A4H74_019925 [Salmonella enterica subsp. enterica serovar Ohio]|nr:hypothetical protein A4H74_019925 [Salmonella enterica subsp. enterica serovar Ohio]